MSDLTDRAADSERLAIAAQQLHIMTGGGRADRCKVLLAEFWRSPADMCPEPAAYRIEFDDYRCGMLLAGGFSPASTTSRVCAVHEEQVRRMPGWRWSSPLAGEASE